MNEEQMKSLFLLAGFKIISHYEIVNQYWPKNENYDEARRKSPWWLVNTEFGLIKIGWRKRVIEIYWKETRTEINATDDDVTKDMHLVHAWGYPKAIEYLISIREQLVKSKKSGVDETSVSLLKPSELIDTLTGVDSTNNTSIEIDDARKLGLFRNYKSTLMQYSDIAARAQKAIQSGRQYFIKLGDAAPVEIDQELVNTFHALALITDLESPQSVAEDPEAVAEAQAICAFESVNPVKVWSYLAEEDKNYWRTVSQAVLHGKPINRLGN